MSIHTFIRGGLALFFVALISGCASAQCKVSRSSCMYEGSYEPGEADYAEQEAAKLNKAQTSKLRQSSGQ
jgi:hypothetical protein